MAIFYKPNGLSSYYLNDDAEVIQTNLAIAWDDDSTATYIGTSTGLYNLGVGTAGQKYLDSMWWKPDGTKVYFAYLNVSNSSAMTIAEHSVGTAWLASTISTSSTSTKIIPNSTTYNLNTTTGMEFNDAGTKITICRRNLNGTTSQSITHLLTYTLSTAWSLSSASLTTTQLIPFLTHSSTTGTEYRTWGYHVMIGGEIIVSRVDSLYELSSISSTTATSSFSANLIGSWFWGDNDTRYFTAGDCGDFGSANTNYTNTKPPVSLTSIHRTNKSPKAGAFSCGYTTNLQMWHNGSSAYMENGDIVYSNAAGTTFGTAGHYGFSPMNGSQAIIKCHINSNGVVSGWATCLI